MTGTNKIASAKSEQRQAALAARTAVGDAQRAAAREAVADRAEGLPAFGSITVVAGYAAIRDELDPAELINRLSKGGHKIALPVVESAGVPLSFREWRPGTELTAGLHGVPVPADGAPRLEPEVILVPVVAFDQLGYRLGYGGGYYDRTLAELRGRRAVIAIGLAFDEQEVESVPHETHDQKLDWIITPSRVIRICEEGSA